METSKKSYLRREFLKQSSSATAGTFLTMGLTPSLFANSVKASVNL